MTKKDDDINQASERINRIINTYCDPEAIENLTKSDYTKVMIESFDDDFSHYLYNHYSVAIVDYQTVLTMNEKDHKGHKHLNDLCLYNPSNHQYRFVHLKDVGIVKAIVRKYYQDSGEINLRIKLLFDSKIGTKYLSKKTGISTDIISEVRHSQKSINDLSANDKLKLENLELNSKIRYHLDRLNISPTFSDYRLWK